MRFYTLAALKEGLKITFTCGSILTTPLNAFSKTWDSEVSQSSVPSSKLDIGKALDLHEGKRARNIPSVDPEHLVAVFPCEFQGREAGATT